MLFYVHAHDNPDVGAELDRLVEEHWSYMDAFDDRMVLRGPTLSADGEEHTGSVHVVELRDRAAAEDFATAEPFWRAGLYREVTVDAVLELRLAAVPPGPATLVTGRWPRVERAMPSPDAEPGDEVVFMAALVDDDATDSTGFLAVVTGDADAAVAAVQPVADQLAGAPVSLRVDNWERGGRR